MKRSVILSAIMLTSVSIIIFMFSCEEEPTSPAVTTVNPGSITKTTASSGGNVTGDGGEEVSVRGVCWNTSENPTTSGNKTSDGSGTGSFTSKISGLTPGVRYYIRAYAVNSAGTGYGRNMSFMTDPVGLATVETAEPSLVTSATALSEGIISDDGGGAVTAKGVCWAKKSSGLPTISNFKTTDGAGAEAFISNVTGLEPATAYFVRAYATNSSGTAYGTEKEFTTDEALPTLTTDSVTSITASSARCGGDVTLDGGSPVTVKGVCWDISPNPTTDKNKTINGSGRGSFVGDLNGLQASRTYYVRAYASNTAGINYGNQQTFTTRSGVMDVTTKAMSEIMAFTAKCGGNVTDDGGSEVTARGVCWSTQPGPTTANSKTIDGGGTGSFVSNLTNLLPGTKYYVRAYVTNSLTTIYGAPQEFTSRDGKASLTVSAVTSVMATTASGGGGIIDDGGSAITTRGVCWGTSQNPLATGSHIVCGSGNGNFTGNITGLLPNTTYFVRTYAINAVTTSYSGTQQEFKTKDGTASITTTAISGIAAASAFSGGTISDDGGSAITQRGVCWGTGSGPTIAGSRTTSGTGTGNYSAAITDLLPDKTYYVRAYATNDIKTTYGLERSFTTKNGIPVIATSPVTNVKAAMVITGGNITEDGGSPITARGVCWSVNPGPTISQNKTTDGAGTGIFTSVPSGLQHYRTYYLRAYATNAYTTSYGEQREFTTLVGDSDGNSYNPVVIGTQTWLKENLRTTKYNDGSNIPHVPDYTEWASLTSPAYCWYNNDIGYKGAYGALYTWYTVKTGKLCPTGWHVPTDAEWTVLVNFHGGDLVAGGKLKEIGFEHWAAPNTGATNEHGFTALPGGWRDGGGAGFQNLTAVSYWWTSTTTNPDAPYWRLIDWDKESISRFVTGDPSFGLSIRCIKDYESKK